ncbi:hypothetical protein [Burkholderia gladioli]|uniref:hypothetical protein n=2 Tax=Burkholderia gladioli TaxID=28095 RepID=UPI0034DAEA0A
MLAPMTVIHLAQTLFAGAEKIAEQLLAMHRLTHNEKVDTLSSPLLLWFDYRLRFIEPRPRQVHYSNRFPSVVTEQFAENFHTLEQAIKLGADLNRFQSKGLVRNDTSGTRRKNRTDLLWAEWGVHHLHTESPELDPGEYFSARADFLLFAIFYHDDVFFIDIHPHSGDDYLFERDSLMMTVAENWPQVIEPFKSRSVSPPTTTWTAADRKQLRSAGINSPLVIDGKVCFSLGGITSAATSTLTVEAQGQLRNDLKSIAEHVLNSREFLSVLPPDAKPEESFSLALTSRGTTLICESTNSGWPFADAKHDGTDGPFARLGYALTPPWIKAALAAKYEQPRG